MTDTNLQRQMKQLASCYQLESEQQITESKSRDEAKQQMADAVTEVLNQFAVEVFQCDERLHRDELPDGEIGLSISYEKRTNSVQPSFQVSITCHPNKVEVNVSDGRWQQVQGVLGSWADWTVEEKVFMGAFDSSSIRTSVECAFLKWYESAMKFPDEPPS